MPGGRPISRDYTKVEGDLICERIMEGMPLDRICAMPDMPCRPTVIKWLTKYPAFAADYARARGFQADHLADEIVHIADTEPDPQIARNRIDARKWVAAKLRPSRYGDRVEVEHSGSVGQAAAPVINVLIQAEKGNDVLTVRTTPGICDTLRDKQALPAANNLQSEPEKS
jgi:hypothetical protein